MSKYRQSSKDRRRCLEAIFRRYPEARLAVGTVVPRFAALTTEGSPEAARGASPRLIQAEARDALVDRLRAEIDEGRLAHGRVWDLDATFYPWGNLALAYEMRIGEELIQPIHAVSVAGRTGGLYLFADQLDAKAFRDAVRRRDGEAQITEELLLDNSGADRLIDAQRGA